MLRFSPSLTEGHSVTNDNFYSELIRWALSQEDEKVGLDALAEKSGYSRWYLNRLFSLRTGMGLGTYLRRHRLEAASEELMRSEKTIAEIAERYHYESQQTFTRAFKRHFGMPPGEWRTLNAVNPFTLPDA